MLIGRFRDVDLAEDALADAFEAAARTWRQDGVPDNPAGWVLTAARRRALDVLRGRDTAARKLPLLAVEAHRQQGDGASDDPASIDADSGGDDELALLLLTCHPALSPEAQAALALRLVLGVPTADIARLFLLPEPTMAARITRAKKKIAQAGVPFVIPAADVLAERVEVAVRTIYLCFTAGYAPASGDQVLRADLAGEAIRLARVLLGVLTARRGPSESVRALLSLMLLQHSRRDARVDGTGQLVLLADQDRSRWHSDEIAEGLLLLNSVRPGGVAEELRLQARLASHHARAASADVTDWAAICTDYALLEAITGSPVVRLNRAVAVAELSGPDAGLTLLDGLDAALPRSHRLLAVRGELLARAGRDGPAREALAQALRHCENDVERRHLSARIADLTEGRGSEQSEGR